MRARVVTVRYEFDSFCDVLLLEHNKYKYTEIDELLNMQTNHRIVSFKFYVDSFSELTLEFDCHKMKNWKYKRTKSVTRQSCIGSIPDILVCQRLLLCSYEHQFI